MSRAAIVCVMSLLFLAACDRAPSDGAPSEPNVVATDAMMAPAPEAARGGVASGEDKAFRGGDVFTYSHLLSLGMPSASVSARFDRARDMCLKDKELSCELLASSINMGNAHTETAPSAQLTVKLPHDQVDIFAGRLIEALPNEAPGDVVVRARSTSADNVTQQVADLARRMAQLTDYRDRLAVLTKRSDVRAAELIQIAGELSKVQTDIEQATAQQHEMADRIAKERLTIDLGEREGSAVWRPIARVSRNALDLLIESSADALRFVIVILPWTPIVALAMVLIAWLWRRLRRGRSRAA